MEIKVTAVLDLVDILKAREIVFSLPEGTTVREFLETMCSRYGPRLEQRIYADKEKDQLKLNLYVNGRLICFLGGLEAVLKDGDTLLLMPFAAGG